MIENCRPSASKFAQKQFAGFSLQSPSFLFNMLIPNRQPAPDTEAFVSDDLFIIYTQVQENGTLTHQTNRNLTQRSLLLRRSSRFGLPLRYAVGQRAKHCQFSWRGSRRRIDYFLQPRRPVQTRQQPSFRQRQYRHAQHPLRSRFRPILSRRRCFRLEKRQNHQNHRRSAPLRRIQSQ